MNSPSLKTCLAHVTELPGNQNVRSRPLLALGFLAANATTRYRYFQVLGQHLRQSFARTMYYCTTLSPPLTFWDLLPSVGQANLPGTVCEVAHTLLTQERCIGSVRRLLMAKAPLPATISRAEIDQRSRESRRRQQNVEALLVSTLPTTGSRVKRRLTPLLRRRPSVLMARCGPTLSSKS
jgi:hypothetical protein